MEKRNVHILIIDDETSIREGVSLILKEEGYRVEAVGDADVALKLIRHHLIDIIVLDLQLPGINGLDFLRYVRQHFDIEIVVISGYATVETVEEIFRAGAFDFIPKPFTTEQLVNSVRRALTKQDFGVQGEPTEPTSRSTDNAEFVLGESRIFQDIFELVKKAGPTDCTVLICGESGTGKALVAREVHRHSRRKHMPFVTVDCGVLVETLFESELFGHIKGAFTGATETRRGSFQLADGGTCFLDEISNISTNIQAKLLRAIQEKEIKSVGSNRALKIDVRIVAATNTVLEEEVAKGRFREDLYYRLGVFPIRLPSIRERKEDIPYIARHFMEKFSRASSKTILGIEEEAMRRLLEYHWPGNIRELENVIERAVIVEESDTLKPGSIYIFSGVAPKHQTAFFNDDLPLCEMEKNYICYILNKCEWNKASAAKVLGIDRKSLYNRLQKYNISQPETSHGHTV